MTIGWWLAALASAPAAGCGTPDGAVAALNAFWAAMSDADAARVTDDITPEFEIYEGGRHFARVDVLAHLTRAADGRPLHRWSVRDPNLHAWCDTALVTYVNDGDADARSPTPPSWFDSAVMRFEGGRWRVTFIQSERKRDAPGG